MRYFLSLPSRNEGAEATGVGFISGKPGRTPLPMWSRNSLSGVTGRTRERSGRVNPSTGIKLTPRESRGGLMPILPSSGLRQPSRAFG